MEQKYINTQYHMNKGHSQNLRNLVKIVKNPNHLPHM